MNSEYEPDLELKAELERLVMPLAPSGTWRDVQARARRKGWKPEGLRPAAAEVEGLSDRRQASEPEDPSPQIFAARRSRLRLAVYASIAVVLVAAIAVGSLEAVQHLGKDQPILVITDDTVSPATTEQTNQTAVGEATSLQSSNWERLPLTSEGGPIGILVMDPTNPSVLYAAGSDGLFKSTDGAQSWERLPMDEGEIWWVGVDPTAPSTVYVYAAEPGVEAYTGDDLALVRSDDGGASWKKLSAAPSPQDFAPQVFGGRPAPFVLLDPAFTPAALYVYCGNDYSPKWARSTDRGETWTIPGPTDSQNDYLPAATAASPSHQSLPPAAQQALDVFLAPFESSPVTVKDPDTGADVPLGEPLVDPSDPSIFYAGTDHGVYKSIDGGATWEKASAGLTCSAVSWVEPDPNSASTLYAGVDEGIVKSIDGGENWRLILPWHVLVPRHVLVPWDMLVPDSLIIAPTSPSTLYSWTTGGLLRSTDGGETWNVSLPGQSSLIMAPSSPSTLYALTQHGLFRSDDGGDSWTRRAGEVLGPSSSRYRIGDLFLVAANDPDILFGEVGAEDGNTGTLGRSADGGDTWSLILGGDDLNLDGGDNVYGLVADPKNPSTLYAVKHMQGQFTWTFREEVLLRSTDTGATWKAIEETVSDPPWGIGGIAVNPYSPSTIYVSRYLLAVRGWATFRSLDDGATWEEVEFVGTPAGSRSLPRFDPRSPDTYYVQADDGLYRSTDAGANWHSITGELPSGVDNFVIDSTSGGGLYAFGSSGLYRWVPGDE